MATNPTIDSGIVSADYAYPNSSTNPTTTAAPSQATQTTSSFPSHRDHTLAPHQEFASHSTDRRQPFQSAHHGITEQKPPLPSREGQDPFQVGTGVSRNGNSTVGEGDRVVSGTDQYYPDSNATSLNSTSNGGHHNGVTHHEGLTSSGVAATRGTAHTNDGMTSTGTRTVDNRSTGEKVKGVAAAIHGTGEAIRGTFNREVDRAFGDVCYPYS